MTRVEENSEEGYLTRHLNGNETMITRHLNGNETMIMIRTSLSLSLSTNKNDKDRGIFGRGLLDTSS